MVSLSFPDIGGDTVRESIAPAVCAIAPQSRAPDTNRAKYGLVQVNIELECHGRIRVRTYFMSSSCATRVHISCMRSAVDSARVKRPCSMHSLRSSIADCRAIRSVGSSVRCHQFRDHPPGGGWRRYRQPAVTTRASADRTNAASSTSVEENDVPRRAGGPPMIPPG